MAGVKGEFAIEDFLASGEILFWICKNLKNYELSEYAKAAILASRDTKLVEKAFLNSKSGKRLIELGYKKDVDFCLQKNITNNVAIYKNKELILYKD
jgi:2-phosphosulfolactate phosphatase